MERPQSIWTIRYGPSPPASWGLRADVEVQIARRHAGNIQTRRGGRVSRGGVQFRREPIARCGAIQCSRDGGDKSIIAGSRHSVVSNAPALPASSAYCEAPGRCCFRAAARNCWRPSVRWRLIVPVVEPKITTTVVSRGDSLWRISRVTYGVGTRYAVVYKANRDRIRDPNRIYPGQIFVLPLKAR